MADLDMEFRPDDIPEDERDVIPAGEYDLQVIESELRETKSGNGEQLVLTLEIITGPFSGRRVWDRLNYRHVNADAQRIAQRSLADLCLATGVTALRKSEELHFKPFRARIGVREDKSGQYGPQNTVRYKKGAATHAPAAPAAAQAAKPAAQSAGPAKPWKKAG